ncbi:hypothetical protein [Parageobacillus thermoglucosidasius]|uniref:hypothetical protein n=1 Tax=Parageobacillus thermoglucosidasius TaxID=1426 RepID=UPI0011D1BC9A|nr:hypothetical protein [Parageobacillus thermoglucosidasius]
MGFSPFIHRQKRIIYAFFEKISMVMEPSFQSIQCGYASKCRGTECFARSGAASCKRRLLLLNLEIQTDLFQLPKQSGTIDKLPSLRPDGSFAATFSIPAAAGDVPLPQIEPESFVPSAVRQRKPQAKRDSLKIFNSNIQCSPIISAFHMFS